MRKQSQNKKVTHPDPYSKSKQWSYATNEKPFQIYAGSDQLYKLNSKNAQKVLNAILFNAQWGIPNMHVLIYRPSNLSYWPDSDVQLAHLKVMSWKDAKEH